MKRLIAVALLLVPLGLFAPAPAGATDYIMTPLQQGGWSDDFEVGPAAEGMGCGAVTNIHPPYSSPDTRLLVNGCGAFPPGGRTFQVGGSTSFHSWWWVDSGEATPELLRMRFQDGKQLLMHKIHVSSPWGYLRAVRFRHEGKAWGWWQGLGNDMWTVYIPSG